MQGSRFRNRWNRVLGGIAVALGLSTAADAASLSVVSDKSSYAVGETITLTVIGDDQGEIDTEVFGRLEYSPALTQTTGASQQRVGASWILYSSLATGDGFADAFNQANGAGSTGDGLAPGGSAFATVTLVAEAAGQVNVTWNTNQGSGLELDFFGLTQAPGTSFTIVGAAACQTNADCNDGDACTQDQCTNGTCSNVAPDGDGDGTPDCTDGCVSDPDKTATGICGCGIADDDNDGDGVADCSDACVGSGTTDEDGDGVCDGIDNCPSVANRGQSDSDGDLVGNACDNCSCEDNGGQGDADRDGAGNACDLLPTIPVGLCVSEVIVTPDQTRADCVPYICL